MKVYFAGPLFTLAERDQIVKILRQRGHQVFQRVLAARQIFHLDVDGLRAADVVVANMDGPDPDSGTCFEVGMAYALGSPVILYRTDIRSEAPPLGPYNLMLHQAAGCVLDLRGISPVEGAMARACRGLR